MDTGHFQAVAQVSQELTGSDPVSIHPSPFLGSRSRQTLNVGVWSDLGDRNMAPPSGHGAGAVLTLPSCAFCVGRVLESEEGRREYLAFPTSKSPGGGQKGRKELLKGNGRRIDYMLHGEEGLCPDWKAVSLGWAGLGSQAVPVAGHSCSTPFGSTELSESGTCQSSRPLGPPRTLPLSAFRKVQARPLLYRMPSESNRDVSSFPPPHSRRRWKNSVLSPSCQA